MKYALAISFCIGAVSIHAASIDASSTGLAGKKGTSSGSNEWFASNPKSGDVIHWYSGSILENANMVDGACCAESSFGPESKFNVSRAGVVTPVNAYTGFSHTDGPGPQFPVIPTRSFTLIPAQKTRQWRRSLEHGWQGWGSWAWWRSRVGGEDAADAGVHPKMRGVNYWSDRLLGAVP